MNNIFDAIPTNLKDEVFEHLVDTSKVKIERIISKGHQSPESGWHDQDKNEWVLLIKGEAVLLFEDKSTVALKAGDYINLVAHTKHKVKWTTSESETIWLAVHY